MKEQVKKILRDAEWIVFHAKMKAISESSSVNDIRGISRIQKYLMKQFDRLYTRGVE